MIDKFGIPTKEDQKTLTFPCPLCRNEGADNQGDNLKVKKATGLITCFKSKEHTDLLRKDNKDLIKQYKVDNNIKTKLPESQFNEQKIKDNTKYLRQCIKNVNEDYNALIEHRGLKVSTLVDLKVGIDLEKSCWVFPVWHYPTNKLIGFEYRDLKMLPRKEGGKLWREEGTFGCLCQLMRKASTQETIVISEGLLDAYCLYQFLSENAIDKYQIITPTCGVSSISTYINELKTKKPFILLLDNDEAARKSIKEIKKVAEIGFYVLKLDKDSKDFQEWYVKRKRV